MSVAAPFFAALVGKPISHVWRGHGSAIFLEFGELTQTTKRDGTPGQPNGELTLMIEWSWRIERPRSILGGSWSSEGRWPAMLTKLQGATVSAVELYARIPEIAISLSNGLHVVSFMTDEGQPAWALMSRLPKIGTLCVRRGALYVELPNL